MAVSLRGRRNAHCCQNLVFPERRHIGALVELTGFDLARSLSAQDVDGIERLHHGRQIVAGIAIGDIAADRPYVANLRIGDLECGLAEDRAFFGKKPRADHLRLGRHRADDEHTCLLPDTLELGDILEIDKVLGCCESQLHHRNEAVASGDHPRFLAKLAEQGHRFADLGRTMVVEARHDRALAGVEVDGDDVSGRR